MMNEMGGGELYEMVLVWTNSPCVGKRQVSVVVQNLKDVFVIIIIFFIFTLFSKKKLL